MIAAPTPIAKNCNPVFFNSLPLFGPVSSNSGITATVPTYKKVPAVNGNNMSPQLRLVPHIPGIFGPLL